MRKKIKTAGVGLERSSGGKKKLSGKCPRRDRELREKEKEKE